MKKLNLDDMYAGLKHGDQPHLLTRTGRRWNVLEPRAEDVSLVDIAHSLSNQARYNGHTHRFYSVAQHAVLVAQEVLRLHGPEAAFAGLHHDSEEAYTGDLVGPLKRLPGMTNFRTIADWTSAAIREAFAVLSTPTIDRMVGAVDGNMLLTEMRDLFNPDYQEGLSDDDHVFDALDHIDIGSESRPPDWSKRDDRFDRAPDPPVERLKRDANYMGRSSKAMSRSPWSDRTHPNSPFITVSCWTPEVAFWQFMCWNQHLGAMVGSPVLGESLHHYREEREREREYSF